MSKREWNFPPESSSWKCTWQDEYGTWGTLPECLGLTDGYRDYDTFSPYRSKSEIIDVLAKFGSASGFWWSIEYDGDEDEPQAKSKTRGNNSKDIFKVHAPDDDEPCALGRREDIDDENFYPVVD